MSRLINKNKKIHKIKRFKQQTSSAPRNDADGKLRKRTNVPAQAIINAIPNAKIKQFFSSFKNQVFKPVQTLRFGKLIDATRPRIYVPKLYSKHKILLLYFKKNQRIFLLAV